MSLHRDETDNHRIESWVFADAAALDASSYSDYVDEDIGRVAYVIDGNTYWRLNDPGDSMTPPEWLPIIVGGTAGVGVPAGGTTDQLLAKINGTDYNTQWVDPPAGGGGFLSPDSPPDSPSAYDDEFDGSSLDGKWSWVNQGGASIAFDRSLLSLTVPDSSGDNCRVIVQTSPAAPYIITGKISIHSLASTLTQVQLGGLILRDSVSGKLVQFDLIYVSGALKLEIIKWTNPTTFSAAYISATQAGTILPQVLYQQIEDDGTDRIFRFSIDGVNFTDLTFNGNTDFLTADQFGFGANAVSSPGSFNFGIDFFRVT